MPYVDGFILAVPKKSLEAYKEIARTAGAVWMDHGALSYVECVGDDVPYGELTSFPRSVQATDDEVVNQTVTITTVRRATTAVVNECSPT